MDGRTESSCHDPSFVPPSTALYFFFSSPSWTVGTVRFDLLIFFHEEGNNEGTDVSILESWAEVLAKSNGVLGAQVEPPFW